MKHQSVIFLMEISRATKFVTSDHYRRSPLIQGGIEIPCKVTAKISRTVINLMITEKYTQFVQELYTEHKNEEIWGSFSRAEAVDNDSITAAPSNVRAPKKKKQNEVQTKDIRKFFNRHETRSNQPERTSNDEKKTNETVIIVDYLIVLMWFE